MEMNNPLWNWAVLLEMHQFRMKLDAPVWNWTVLFDTERSFLKLNGPKRLIFWMLRVNFMCYDRSVWEQFDRSLSDIYFERWLVLKILSTFSRLNSPFEPNRPSTFGMNLYPLLFRILAGSSKSDYINTLLMLNI